MTKNRLALWQRLELAGLATIFCSIFLQLFVLVNLRDVKSADDYATEMRLQQIYVAVTTGKKIGPKWETIDTFAKGDTNPDDWHWRFDEVDQFSSSATAILFLVGSFLTLIGKWLEHKYGRENG